MERRTLECRTARRRQTAPVAGQQLPVRDRTRGGSPMVSARRALVCTPRRASMVGGAVLAVVAAQAVAARALPPAPLVRMVAVGQHPLAVAIAPHTGRAFVANSGSNSVSMLDARSGAVVRTVKVGTYPDAV